VIRLRLREYSDRSRGRLALNLRNLEDRTVPAQFAIELIPAPTGIAGASAAVHTGSLYLNPAFASSAGISWMPISIIGPTV